MHKELDKIRLEKEAAVKAGNFDKAAKLRDEERKLRESAGRPPEGSL